MNKSPYYVDFLQFNSPQYVKSDCADITFINNALEGYILINGVVKLYPNQSLTISANFDEIDTTIYRVDCDSIFLGANQTFAVLRKCYK